MFDISWSELVVIGVVALIAIGPKELPGVLRSVGQWVGKIRRMSAEFQGQFQEALREAEMADLRKHAEDIKTSVSNFTNVDPLADTAPTPPHAETPAETAPAVATTAEVEATLPAPAEQVVNDPVPEPTSVTLVDVPAPTLPEPPAKIAGSGA